ncbi:hypothetical protein CHUUTOTORO_00640 [Serratia phage vB_SmaM-ChuuTotoro]|nr:hypothetical protein CHUUTOTORO_00640 [Serratia phage vB_SmaM-ChuuTotoro]
MLILVLLFRNITSVDKSWAGGKMITDWFGGKDEG